MISCNPAAWPAAIRRTVLVIVDVMAAAVVVARNRALIHTSPATRLVAEAALWRAKALRLEAENEILRTRLQKLPPQFRPHYPPECRFRIILMARQYALPIWEVANRFVLDRKTVSRWLKAVKQGGKRLTRLLGEPPVNKLADLVRWLVHLLKEYEPLWGTRKIAAALVRAGIRLARVSVQRILREKSPKRRVRVVAVPKSEEPFEPYGLLRPQPSKPVWHIDCTTIDVLLGWIRFHIVSILDGRSRKVLALRAYLRVPNTQDMIRLVRYAMKKYGTPRFVITDRGSIFKKRFRAYLRRNGIEHIYARIHGCNLNGKVERFFKTLKYEYLRYVFFAWNVAALQKRLDEFAEYYNGHRPHSGLGFHTPDEVWRGEGKRVRRRKRGKAKKYPDDLYLVRRLLHDDRALPVYTVERTA